MRLTIQSWVEGLGLEERRLQRSAFVRPHSCRECVCSLPYLCNVQSSHVCLFLPRSLRISSKSLWEATFPNTLSFCVARNCCGSLPLGPGYLYFICPVLCFKHSVVDGSLKRLASCCRQHQPQLGKDDSFWFWVGTTVLVNSSSALLGHSKEQCPTLMLSLESCLLRTSLSNSKLMCARQLDTAATYIF